MKKVIIALLLSCSFAACSSFNSFNVDEESNLDYSNTTELLTADEEIFVDVTNVGVEHNETLQLLMDACSSSDFSFEENIDLWINLVNEKSSAFGYPLTDEEISSLRDIMYSFHVQCLQSNDIDSALHQLISTFPCEEYFLEGLHEVVNNIDFYEVEQYDNFIGQIDILEGHIVGTAYEDEYMPYTQSIRFIADASYEYWSNYYHENAEYYAEQNDSTNRNSEREENLKTLRCAVVDALAAGGAAATGVGATLSGVVGAGASFIWAEAVEGIVMQ